MASYRLHIVAGSTRNFYRIGYFEERADRSQTDRMSELNRQTSVKGTETELHQPYRELALGGVTYPDTRSVRRAKTDLRRALEAAGARFVGQTIFEYGAGDPAAVLQNLSQSS